MIEASCLQNYSLFGGLLTEQVNSIMPLLCYAAYDTGTVIITEGAKNDSIFFLLAGRVEVSKSGHVLVELPEGQVFGEMELLDIMPSAATIRTLEPVQVAILSNAALHCLYHQDRTIFSIIMMNLARDLSRRLRHMDDVLIKTCLDRPT